MSPAERAARRQYLVNAIAEYQGRADSSVHGSATIDMPISVCLDLAERYRRELRCLDHNSAKEKV